MKKLILIFILTASPALAQTGFNQNGCAGASSTDVHAVGGCQSPTTPTLPAGNLYASDYAGADAGEQIQACLNAAASASVGCIDNLGTTQASAADIVVPAYTTLWVNRTTLTLASGHVVTVADHGVILGGGKSLSTIVGTVNGNGVVQFNTGSGQRIENIAVKNNDSTDVGSAAIQSSVSIPTGTNLYLLNGYYNLSIPNGYNGIWTNITTSNPSGNTVYSNVHLGSPTSAANQTTFINLVAGGGLYSCIDNDNSEAVAIYGFDCENGTGLTQTAVSLEKETAGAAPDISVTNGYVQIGGTDGTNYCSTNNGGTVEFYNVWFQSCTGNTGTSPQGKGDTLYIGNATQMKWADANGKMVSVSPYEGLLNIFNTSNPGITFGGLADGVTYALKYLSPDVMTIRDSNASLSFLFDVYGKLQVDGTANFKSSITLGNTTATWTSASGVPSGSCTTGSLYTNTAGGTGTTLYVCESGSWVAK